MVSKLRIHLYADGADVRDMLSARESGIVKGFTTNPTLMRKSGVTDYEAFAKEALRALVSPPFGTCTLCRGRSRHMILFLWR